MNLMDLFNVPNILTLLRILCSPVVLYFALERQWLLLLVVGIFACFTDFLDGNLARKLDQKTRIGEIIDPIADKIFVSFLIFAYYKLGLLELWFIFCVLLRDILILLCGVFYLNRDVRNINISPHFSSKLNTSLIMFLFTFIPVNQMFKMDASFIIFFLQASILITVLYSGVIYAIRFFKSSKV